MLAVIIISLLIIYFIVLFCAPLAEDPEIIVLDSIVERLRREQNTRHESELRLQHELRCGDF